MFIPLVGPTALASAPVVDLVDAARSIKGIVAAIADEALVDGTRRTGEAVLSHRAAYGNDIVEVIGSDDFAGAVLLLDRSDSVAPFGRGEGDDDAREAAGVIVDLVPAAGAVSLLNLAAIRWCRCRCCR